MEDTPHQVCLACGDTSGDFVKKEDSQENFHLVERFCKLLGVTWEKDTQLQEDEEILFCGGCEARLQVLLEVEHDLILLRRELETKIAELKGFVEESEGNFERGSVYFKRREYWKIRSQIVTVTKEPDYHDNNQEGADNSSKRQTRKGRRFLSKTNSIPSNIEENCSSNGGSGLITPEPVEEAPLPKKRRKIRVIVEESSDPDYDADPSFEDNEKSDRDSWSEEDSEPATNRMKTIKIGSVSAQENPSTGTLIVLGTTFEKESNGKYRCLACVDIRKGLFSRLGVVIHARWGKHYTDRYECPICGKPFTGEFRLKCHMTTHLSAEEKAELVSAGKAFPARPPKENPKKKQCDLCGKGFRDKTALERHMYTKHPDPEKEAQFHEQFKTICPDCGQLVAKGYLKDHQLSRHSSSQGWSRKFLCGICDKLFTTKSHLNKHKRVVHEGRRPHKCPMCTRTFATERQMKSHVNTHLNIRPFQCEACPAAFVLKHQLERHFKTYHAEGANPKRTTFQKGAMEKKS